MKETDDSKLRNKLGTNNPFSVPEGYFEQFNQRLMEQLPEKEFVPTQHITMWQRVRPWFYLAAMFCGILFGVRYMLSPHISNMAANETGATGETNSYYDEYLEDVVVYSNMDDYSVYCYLNESDKNS